MKIKYLNQYRHYKPEYDISDFARVNCMEDYNPYTILKLMKALYPLWLNENRPEYNEVLEPNQN
jgi:hypothetical protein